jgi:hypothetical protein
MSVGQVVQQRTIRTAIRRPIHGRNRHRKPPPDPRA